jgi:membrane protein implicated in regulation of membrane protease activity
VIYGDANVGLAIEIVFLLCIALCFWKQLWIALGVLAAFIVAANVCFFALEAKAWAVFLALAGVFFAFPAAVYLNLEGREREDRRRSIRRSRKHTGRE